LPKFAAGEMELPIKQPTKHIQNKARFFANEQAARVLSLV